MKTKRIIRTTFHALTELHDLHSALVLAKLDGYVEEHKRRELERLSHDFLRALNAAPVEEL